MGRTGSPPWTQRAATPLTYARLVLNSALRLGQPRKTVDLKQDKVFGYRPLWYLLPNFSQAESS